MVVTVVADVWMVVRCLVLNLNERFPRLQFHWIREHHPDCSVENNKYEGKHLFNPVIISSVVQAERS